MQLLSEGGMSRCDMAGEARDWEPRLQTWRSCTLSTPSISSMPERISLREMPCGVPSNRMLSVSRTMPMEDQRIRAAIRSERRDRSSLPGVEDACAAGDDSGGGKRVSGHVEEGGAHVYVAGHRPKAERRLRRS